MNRRTRKTLAVFIPLMVLALACTCTDIIPSGDETEEPDVESTLPPLDDVLLEDDFSSSSSGWETGEWDTGTLDYENGVYAVVSTQAEQLMWGLAGESFGDIVIEVEATQISAGPDDNNAYGVGCRIQPNGEDGYYIRISGDGFYAIDKAEDGEINERLVGWEESSAIRLGDATNRMRVICDGSSIILFVNGERVDSVQDSTYSRGDIALVAMTYEDVPTEIHFDNIVVREAQGP